MSSPRSALVIENDPKDLFAAASAAREAGVKSIVSFESSSKAVQFLDLCLAGQRVLPDLFIVDLDLGQESGYEILRYRRTTNSLASTPLIVWSVLGQDHEQFCEVFKVDRFVSKSEGKEALKDAIHEVLACLLK